MLIRRLDETTTPEQPLFRQSYLEYPEDLKSMKNSLRKILNNIAQNGEVPEDVTWSEVIRLLEFMIIEESQSFKERSGYVVPKEDEEGYDSFDQNLEVLITLLGGFREKPPFTLQRICELVVSGRDIYAQTHHFMFALEKCLNISLGVS